MLIWPFLYLHIRWKIPPPLQHVLRSYKIWESERFPVHDVRVGISAGVVRKFWRKATREGVTAVCVRDEAVVVLVFIFGLGESIVLKLKLSDILHLSSARCEVIIRTLKGRTTDQVVRRGSRFFTSSSSGETPLSVLVKYMVSRGTTSNFLFRNRSAG